MKLVCALKDHKFPASKGTTEVLLYSRSDRQTRGGVGAAIAKKLSDSKLHAAPRAWDFLSLSLAVIAADLAGHRRNSPDGWTRQLDLDVAVIDPDFWNSQRELVNKLLGFLTTDVWRVTFIEGGYSPKPPSKPVIPPEDCVSLLSGGLDSLIGNVDLVATGKKPLVVSQTVLGDGEKQRLFAQVIGGGLRHLQLNHNAEVPEPETPSSQRARSLIFLAYGALAATTLKHYHSGDTATLYVCENGFISINPPLTAMRLGSLSTRTTNPVFLDLVRDLFEAAGLRVQLENPYQLKTKGEMLKECADQAFVNAYACQATSCGRYLIHGHKHCGRCVPCLVRRAAFKSSGISDTTKYVFKELGRDDCDHAGFDDVRSVAMALAAVDAEGLERWIGASLSTALLGDVGPIEAMVGRGMGELRRLLKSYGVK